MALKTLQDLKINDIVYSINSSGEISTSKINLISTTEIQTNCNHTFEYKHDDRTVHQFEAFWRSEKYPQKFYLNKVSVLKIRSKMLNQQIQELFEKHRYFLEQLTALNNKLLENNLEIVNESKND
jgi:hypothetical protein